MKTCLKCNVLIPNWMKIGGARHSLSSRKFCLTCSPFKMHNTKNLLSSTHASLHPKEKICSICNKVKPINQFYFLKNKNAFLSRCNSCDRELSLRKNRGLKKLCVDYKGGKCESCGYSRNIAAFDFHHRDPSQKDFTISTVRAKNINKLKKELDKCTLLCANCHREFHSNGVAAQTSTANPSLGG